MISSHRDEPGLDTTSLGRRHIREGDRVFAEVSRRVEEWGGWSLQRATRRPTGTTRRGGMRSASGGACTYRGRRPNTLIAAAAASSVRLYVSLAFRDALRWPQGGAFLGDM